jgi:hypothetical protein
MVNAVDDGTGPRAGDASYAGRAHGACAARLPLCSIRVLEPDDASRRGVGRPSVRSLLDCRCRRRCTTSPTMVPDGPGDPAVGTRAMGKQSSCSLDGDAQQSSGFFIGGGAGTVIEPPCALRVRSSIVPVTRTASTVASSRSVGSESVFTATTDVPVALPDSQLGVGITARHASRARHAAVDRGRDTVHRSRAATLKLPEPTRHQLTHSPARVSRLVAGHRECEQGREHVGPKLGLADTQGAAIGPAQIGEQGPQQGHNG